MTSHRWCRWGEGYTPGLGALLLVQACARTEKVQMKVFQLMQSLQLMPLSLVFRTHAAHSSGRNNGEWNTCSNRLGLHKRKLCLCLFQPSFNTGWNSSKLRPTHCAAELTTSSRCSKWQLQLLLVSLRIQCRWTTFIPSRQRSHHLVHVATCLTTCKTLHSCSEILPFVDYVMRKCTRPSLLFCTYKRQKLGGGLGTRLLTVQFTVNN